MSATYGSSQYMRATTCQPLRRTRRDVWAEASPCCPAVNLVRAACKPPESLSPPLLYCSQRVDPVQHRRHLFHTWSRLGRDVRHAILTCRGWLHSTRKSIAKKEGDSFSDLARFSCSYFCC